MVVCEREAVVVGFRVTDEDYDNLIGKLRGQRRVGEILESKLKRKCVSDLGQGHGGRGSACLELLPVHMPKTSHKNLVLFGEPRSDGKVLRKL